MQFSCVTSVDHYIGHYIYFITGMDHVVHLIYIAIQKVHSQKRYVKLKYEWQQEVREEELFQRSLIKNIYFEIDFWLIFP